MRSRSGIAGAHTTVVQGIDGDRGGARSLQTTLGIDCGGTAGEEEDVSVYFHLLALFVCLCIFCDLSHGFPFHYSKIPLSPQNKPHNFGHRRGPVCCSFVVLVFCFILFQNVLVCSILTY